MIIFFVLGASFEVEGWREEVKAGQLQLLSEDLVLLLRNAVWGGQEVLPRTPAGGAAGAEEVGVG